MIKSDKRSRITDDLYLGLETQAPFPIANLFGDTQWTYVGQKENQERSLQIEPTYVNDGIPIEIVRTYAMLTMRVGDRMGSRNGPINGLILLTLALILPNWVVFLLLGWCVFAILFAQRRYRKALALADQFYDRTVHRYVGDCFEVHNSRIDVVKRVIAV